MKKCFAGCQIEMLLTCPIKRCPAHGCLFAKFLKSWLSGKISVKNCFDSCSLLIHAVMIRKLFRKKSFWEKSKNFVKNRFKHGAVDHVTFILIVFCFYLKQFDHRREKFPFIYSDMKNLILGTDIFFKNQRT